MTATQAMNRRPTANIAIGPQHHFDHAMFVNPTHEHFLLHVHPYPSRATAGHGQMSRSLETYSALVCKSFSACIKFESMSSTSGHTQPIIAKLEQHHQHMTSKVCKRPNTYQVFDQCSAMISSGESRAAAVPTARTQIRLQG